MEEQEIDLRKYISSLLAYWYFPVGFLLAGILLTAGLAARQPKVYQARVLVAAITTPNQGATNEAFGTFLNQFFTSAAERKQHMAALQTLVQNPAVAQAVLDDMADTLPEALRHPEPLLRSVSSRLVSGTDLIEVSVSHADPQLALALANAWAQAYVSQVEEVYGDAREQQHQVVVSQIVEARAKCDRAESAWEDTLRQDRFARLSREMADRQAILQALSAASDTALARLVDEIGRTERLLADVQALQAQMGAGGSASANAPSLLMLQARALTSLWDSKSVTLQPQPHPADVGIPTASTSTLGSTASGAAATSGGSSVPAPAISPQLLALQLQSGVPTMTAREIIVELKLLDQALQARLLSLRQALDATNRALQKGGEIPAVGLASSGTAQQNSTAADAIPALEQQIRDLRAQMVQEESHLQMVRAERDLAWETYQKLRRQEVDLALGLANRQEGLRIAAPARVSDPSASGRASRLLSGAVIGAVLGSLVALAFGWVRRRQTN
jgi:capsular polysaccharide biosynthesis protein